MISFTGESKLRGGFQFMASSNFVDDLSKLDHAGFPPIEAFRSSLKKEDASDPYYLTCSVCAQGIALRALQGILTVYLKTDVLRLPDIFENSGLRV